MATPSTTIDGSWCRSITRQDLLGHSTFEVSDGDGIFDPGIRAGLNYFVARTETRAAVVMVCDQSGVGAPLINKSVYAHRTTGASLVAAKDSPLADDPQR